MPRLRLFAPICLLSLLAASLAACAGNQAVANEGLTMVRILTQGEQTQTVEETVDVRYCVAQEQTEISCSAGTAASFSTSSELGVAADPASVSFGADFGLSFNRDSGAALTLDPAPEGYVNRYTVAKTYQVIAGEAVARDAQGAERRVPYTFQASCSLQIVKIEALTCAQADAVAAAAPTAPPAPGPRPEGGQVLVGSSRDGNEEIYLVDVATGAPTRLTYEPGVDTAPGWSPDGERIVFISERDGRRDLYVMAPDGSAPTRISNLPDGEPMELLEVSAPAWSPDGSRIAVACKGGLCLLNPDGSDLVRVSSLDSPFNASPVWAHDSSEVYYRNFTGGFTYNIVAATPDGATTRMIDADAGPGETVLLAPDGRQLAYTAQSGLSIRLFVVDVAGGEPTQLSEWLNVSITAWSPDSHTLAYVALAGKLVLVDVDGGESREFAPGDVLGIPTLSWLPDGRTLLLRTVSKLRAFDLESGKERVLVADLGAVKRAYPPAWRP